jgi:hypothetical protein
MKLIPLFFAFLVLLIPALLRAQEVMPTGGMEKRVLFGPETAREWSPAESSIEASAEHTRGGAASLHWHVTVDYTTGEPGYPIGWPRVNHAIPLGPARDWSAWDYLHMWVYADTSRAALPRVPAALLLYAPDRAGEYDRPLTELKKGQWVEINIPLASMLRHNDVRLFQFYLSEADYRDRDRVDLYIDDLALMRYSQPTLLEFGPERTVMFADARSIPTKFRLTGINAPERVPVSCELRQEARIVARGSMTAERGLQRLRLDLGPGKLEPGTYELTGHVAGSRQMARAKLRLVESPWR